MFIVFSECNDHWSDMNASSDKYEIQKKTRSFETSQLFNSSIVFNPFIVLKNIKIRYLPT